MRSCRYPAHKLNRTTCVSRFTVFSLFQVDKKTREEVVFDKKGKHRRAFERRLRALGLELEQCAAERSKTGFVLVHAPFRVLVRQADLLKLKKAVYQNEIIDVSSVSRR